MNRFWSFVKGCWPIITYICWPENVYYCFNMFTLLGHLFLSKSLARDKFQKNIQIYEFLCKRRRLRSEQIFQTLGYSHCPAHSVYHLFSGVLVDLVVVACWSSRLLLIYQFHKDIFNNIPSQILRQWNKFRVWGKWNVPACWLKYITSTLCIKKYKLNPEMDFCMDFYGYVLFDEINSQSNTIAYQNRICRKWVRYPVQAKVWKWW